MTDSARQIAKRLELNGPVYAYCVDPGAWNLVAPVIETLRERGQDPKLILDGWCSRHAGQPSSLSLSQFAEGLLDGRFPRGCLLLGSQMCFSTTRRLIALCRLCGLTSYFVFDHWCNYHHHFVDQASGRVYLPDFIMVPDDLAREKLIEEMADHEPEVGQRISVVGHPGIESDLQKIARIEEGAKERIKHRLGVNGQGMVLVLLEPLSSDFGHDHQGRPRLGYCEYSFLGEFFNRYPVGGRKVVIKPHPRQPGGRIRDFVARLAPVQEWRVEEGEELTDLIAVADEVAGMTTVALITALKAGKPIKSLQPGRNSAGRSLSNAHIEKYLFLA